MWSFYLILRSGVLMFRISNINQCVKNFLRLRKVEFIKWINLSFCLLGLLSNSSRLTNQFWVWFSLAQRRTAVEFFQCHFLRKKKAALSFSFLLGYASRTCSMPRQYFFCSYLFPNHVKILSKFSKFSAINFKTQKKNFVMMTSIVHLSSNRS